MQLDFTIVYIRWKNLVIADTLSRASLSKPDENDRLFQKETSAYVDSIIQDLLATEHTLEEIIGLVRREIQYAKR